MANPLALEVVMRTPSLSVSRLALAAALSAVLSATPAVAQQGTATLVAVVTDAATGEPLGAARVRLRGTRAEGSTDAAGRLVLRGLPSGTVGVEVTRLGYSTLVTEVGLEGGRSRDLPLELRVAPVALDPIAAQAATRESWSQRMLQSRGFFTRKGGGPGVFMVRDDIMRTRSRTMAQLLSRHRRLNMGHEAWGSQTTARRFRRPGSGAPVCRPAFYVDGILLEDFDVNTVNPESVEALEIYRGSSEVPPAFSRGTTGCGAVVIWTRVN